jgi:GT2 family glycosyltransferase
MDISCVIVSWNSERYISKCLNSLIQDLEQQHLSHEIFIVDNGSLDQTPTILKAFHEQYPDRIVPLFLNRNTGTTCSRNLALKQVRGRYLCVLDSDVEVLPGAIAQLVRVLEGDRNIGLVAPRLVYPNGNLQKSTDVFPTITTKALRYFFLRWIERHNNNRVGGCTGRQPSLCEVDYAISAMWIFKREILEQVGFLDENIFYAPEDVDYCLRIWKTGSTVMYNAAAACIHHTQEISRGRFNRATMQHVWGLCYYFRKHRCFFVRPKRK